MMTARLTHLCAQGTSRDIAAKQVPAHFLTEGEGVLFDINLPREMGLWDHLQITAGPVVSAVPVWGLIGGKRSTGDRFNRSVILVFPTMLVTVEVHSTLVGPAAAPTLFQSSGAHGNAYANMQLAADGGRRLPCITKECQRGAGLNGPVRVSVKQRREDCMGGGEVYYCDTDDGDGDSDSDDADGRS